MIKVIKGHRLDYEVSTPRVAIDFTVEYSTVDAARMDCDKCKQRSLITTHLVTRAYRAKTLDARVKHVFLCTGCAKKGGLI